jgi:hypothetical protein
MAHHPAGQNTRDHAWSCPLPLESFKSYQKPGQMRSLRAIPNFCKMLSGCLPVNKNDDCESRRIRPSA